jgi:hypothetical protein
MWDRTFMMRLSTGAPQLAEMTDRLAAASDTRAGDGRNRCAIG